MPSPAVADTVNLWPFGILAICVATIIILITVLRIHAFLALIAVAILAGLLTPHGALPGEPAKGLWVQAVELTTVEFGSMICSWMNDSGFWVVGKLSGFTEKETLKSWTLLVTVISVVGLLECLVFSAVLPFKAGGG